MDNDNQRNLEMITVACVTENSKDPVKVLRRLMKLPFCRMHGPEHHVLAGAALLTAYKNAGGEIDLEKSIAELQSRALKVPGGACGYWGACGAALSAGMFVSIITEATPLKNKEWSMSIFMTSEALGGIAANGGPRCCKRNSYTAILKATEFVKENLGVEMELDNDLKCIHQAENSQCIRERCPFNAT